MTESTADVVATGEPGQASRAAGGAAASPVHLTMPMPPSVNNAFINRRAGGRAKSPRAKDWESHALWYVKAQRPPLLTGPVIVVFGFERTSMTADADNRLKLALDLLVTAGVLGDDRNVVGLAASWMPAANGLAHVMIAPLHAAALEFHVSQDGASGTWVMTAPQPDEEA